MNLLITGCAGFIGTNFVKYYLKKYPTRRVIGLDKLTYAGNVENLKAELARAARSPIDNSNLSAEPSLELPQPSDPDCFNYKLSSSKIVFVRGDIVDRELVEGLFQEYEIDGVINFAAESHVDRSIHDPQIFLKTNVLGTQVLLEAARKYWKTTESNWKRVTGENKSEEKNTINHSANLSDDRTVKFLQISTDEVYGSLGKSGYFTEKSALDPHSPYSASKAAADLIVKAYHDTYGLPVNITRCSNNYGPYQFPEKLIPLMINNALDHIPLPVYGDGRQVRDWLYVEDHCRAIDLVFESGRIGEVYNIGGHNERENIYIVEKILELLRAKTGDGTINETLIKHVTDRLGHDRRYAIDPTKIRVELGWEPTVLFEEGLARTVDWYLSNRKLD